MSKKQFDMEKLKEIPINEVLIKLGASYKNDREPGIRTYNMHCMGTGHKNGDKNPSLSVWKDKNICKCQSQGCVAGDPVSVARQFHNNDFVEGCTWLHNTFNIPYIDGETTPPMQTKDAEAQTHTAPAAKTADYMRLEASAIKHVDLQAYLPKYEKMNKEQQLKMVYSFVYDYSLKTNQNKKLSYYESRSIDTSNPYIKKIGFLSGYDIRNLEKLLKENFPIEDLIEFKLFKPASDKYPSGWKYYSKAGYTVVPFMDTYTDMVNGVMLRRVDKEEKGKKEYQISCNEISLAIPFALNAELLQGDEPIYICEGHVDGLSSGKKFIAIPGVNGYKEEWLGLLKSKSIIIALDQDTAAQKAVYGEYIISYDVKILGRDFTVDRQERFIATPEAELYLKELIRNGHKVTVNKQEGLMDKLKNAGAFSVEILRWNPELGGDINELLESGNLYKVIK